MNHLIYEAKRHITSAYIDSSVKLGVAQAVVLLQDNLTECFQMLGCDGIVYREKFNACWVFTKTKVHFHRRPDWAEFVTARTFPTDNAGMRTHINTEVLDAAGNALLHANQEVCVMSLETRRPLRLSNLPYPNDGFPAAIFDEPFEKFDGAFDESNFVFEQPVRSCHIDMSHHVNNIEYIRLAMSVFDDEYRRSHDVSDIEVHYLGESREGQTLRVYCVPSGDKSYIYITESARKIFECCLRFA